jgi:hypothetical protein
MPPQQPDRLLDLSDEVFDFSAHCARPVLLAYCPPAPRLLVLPHPAWEPSRPVVTVIARSSRAMTVTREVSENLLNGM